MAARVRQDGRRIGQSAPPRRLTFLPQRCRCVRDWDALVLISYALGQTWGRGGATTIGAGDGCIDYPRFATSAEADAFLSHDSVDTDVARKLARDLATLGVDTWIDKWELEPGVQLDQMIE